MELQGDRAPADLEGLVRAARVGGQAHGSGRQIERLAVPVERQVLGRELERRLHAGDALDREPADLLRRSGVHAGAERAGQELRTEADAEHRHAAVDGLADELLLGPQPGELMLVVHAHGPAHGNQGVDLLGARQRVAGEEPRESELHAPRRQPRRHAARSLERDVLEHLDFHATSLPAAGHIRGGSNFPARPAAVAR